MSTADTYNIQEGRFELTFSGHLSHLHAFDATTGEKIGTPYLTSNGIDTSDSLGYLMSRLARGDTNTQFLEARETQFDLNVSVLAANLEHATELVKKAGFTVKPEPEPKGFTPGTIVRDHGSTLVRVDDGRWLRIWDGAEVKTVVSVLTDTTVSGLLDDAELEVLDATTDEYPLVIRLTGSMFNLRGPEDKIITAKCDDVTSGEITYYRSADNTLAHSERGRVYSAELLFDPAADK